MIKYLSKPVMFSTLALSVVVLSGCTSGKAQSKSGSFDAFLNSEAQVEELDGKSATLSELAYGYDVSYTLSDLDKDGTDELFVLAGPSAYVVKNESGAFKVIYDGCGYEKPISTDDFTGVLYYRPGQAPLNEIYMFTEFSEGEKTGKSYASWYDDNENNVMDKEDVFFLDSEDEVEVSMEDWIAAAQKFIDHKDDDIEWTTIEEKNS